MTRLSTLLGTIRPATHVTTAHGSDSMLQPGVCMCELYPCVSGVQVGVCAAALPEA